MYGMAGQGPGNLKANSDKVSFLCAGTVTAGEHVTLSGNNYSVATGSATTFPIGIAEQSGVAGDWIEVCVGGQTTQTITTNGSVAIGDMLVCAAAGAVIGVAPASLTAAQHGIVVGYSPIADVSNDLAGCLVIKKIGG